MGSVKDLVIALRPTRYSMGAGRFIFSDRYSVFDWGNMPDMIPNKGASLCVMSAYFFEELMRQGIGTHYLGLGENEMLYTSNLSEPTNTMIVALARVLKPENVGGSEHVEYDYSRFHRDERTFLVPLEIIYRNTLPKGSSVFRRLKEGSLSLSSLGLSEMPSEGSDLPSMFLDVSTKHEHFDRYPDERVGESVGYFFSELAGMTLSEISEVRHILLTANGVITDGMLRAGMENEDGKLELAFDPRRQLIVADTLGTLDECRFTYGGEQLSKQIPRDWYEHSQPGWTGQIKAAKASGREDWKSLVTEQPEPLPGSLKDLLGHVYGSVANAILARQLFDAPSVEEVAREYRRFRELEMR